MASIRMSSLAPSSSLSRAARSRARSETSARATDNSLSTSTSSMAPRSTPAIGLAAATV
jgi:hypothetical protein